MDRHGLRPRDDKGSLSAKCLSLRGGGQDDAAIHRVSENAGGFVCSGNEGQWIATGYALAMTRIGVKERSELSFHSSPFNLHSFSLAARFVWPGSATGQDFPRFFITGFFGNRHGSLLGCGGNRGCCGCAQLNAWSARGCSRNHPAGPDTSPMLVQWDQPPGCR